MGAVAVIATVAAAAGIGIGGTDAQRAAVDETQYLLTAISIAEDGDLDIADELEFRRWASFSAVEPPVQTAVLADGSQISPHDPLLPLLLAAPVDAGGWVGAKVAMAVLAGALAALTLWVAVRRLGVPPATALVGVGLAAASAPLAVYGQQLYPELPAALLVVTAVAALTGPADRRHLGLLVTVLATVPWLSVKYVPVVAALAAVGALRWWHAGHRGDVLRGAAVLAAAGAVYLAVHRVVWGGWTVYATGDHFTARGEFAVVGDEVNPLGRAGRLVGLLLDRDYGLAAWQPAYLLLVPAAAALLVHRPRWLPAVAAPLAAGWLVATFVAATMHGFWWPGRHVLVVVPLAVLVILAWAARSGRVARLAAAALGGLGVLAYAGLLVDGYTGAFTWVLGFPHVTGPDRTPLPDYRLPLDAIQLVWAAVVIGLGAAGAVAARRRTASSTTP
jgi:hypothetical protein